MVKLSEESKFVKYLIKRPTKRFFSLETKREKLTSLLVVSIALTSFLFFLINRPQYFEISISYLSIGFLGLILALYINKILSGSGSVGFKGQYGYKIIVPLSLAIAVLTIAVNAFLSSVTGTIFLGAMTLSLTPTLWGDWLITGILIPIMEENTFNRVITPSFTMIGGSLLGVLGAVSWFVFFHWSVYGFALPALIFLAVFRFSTSLITIETRSWLPGLVAHIALNSTIVILSSI